MPVEYKSFLIIATLIILGLFFIIMNWAILINNLVLKRKPASFVPLLGGGLLCFGLAAVQQPLISKYAYLAFLIDMGSIPLFLNMLYHFIKFLIKKFLGKGS